MLGRSMGGGVTLNALVTQPGLVDAAVIYASVSSRFLDNLDHFTRAEPARGGRTALFDRFGTPQEAPRFYRELSPRTFFDRITEPVLIHHGTVDGTCPSAVGARPPSGCWSRPACDSTAALVPGEKHAFYARWQDSIGRRPSGSCARPSSSAAETASTAVTGGSPWRVASAGVVTAVS